MIFDAVASVIITMQELRERENQKRRELDMALAELAGVQRRIVSIEQDLSNLKEEYLRLDDEVRPNMAVYLKSETRPKETEKYLF